MMKSYQVSVFGIVQGVGFRWFAQQTARTYHIVGWVKNESNGSVLMHIRGKETDIIDFIATIQQGTGFSRVDKIIKEVIIPFDANSFAIR